MMQNARSHPTSTPQHETFYLMIFVTFEREGQENWPFFPQVDVAVRWVHKNKFKKKMNTK
jgi:hypothetical protein